MSLREKLFLRYCRKHIQPAPRFPHWDKVQTVCLLYENNLNADQQQAVHACCQLLLKAGKTPCVVAYTDAKVPDNQVGELAFSSKDFSWLGRPKKQLLEALQTHHADLLIDLSQRPLLSMRYLAFCANADFKAGRKLSSADEDGIHHFLLQTDNEGTLFVFQQIVHYLTSIHSND